MSEVLDHAILHLRNYALDEDAAGNDARFEELLSLCTKLAELKAALAVPDGEVERALAALRAGGAAIVLCGEARDGATAHETVWDAMQAALAVPGALNHSKGVLESVESPPSPAAGGREEDGLDAEIAAFERMKLRGAFVKFDPKTWVVFRGGGFVFHSMDFATAATWAEPYLEDPNQTVLIRQIEEEPAFIPAFVVSPSPAPAGPTLRPRHVLQSIVATNGLEWPESVEKAKRELAAWDALEGVAPAGAGWRLVPEEPTPEMIDRMTASVSYDDLPPAGAAPDPDYSDDMRRAYRAALAASPAAQGGR